MTTRWARVARGTLAACFAVFVAALFHAAAGGGVPSILAVTVCLAFAVPTCVLLAGKRMSLWRQVLSVSLSQFALHALFSLSPGAASFQTAGGSAHFHAGSQMVMSSGAASGGAGASGAMSTMPDGPLMWLGHAGAVVLTVVALRCGESAFRALLSTAAIRAVTFALRQAQGPMAQGPEPVRPAPELSRIVDARPVILPEPCVLIGRMRHRGPPAGLLAFP